MISHSSGKVVGWSNRSSIAGPSIPARSVLFVLAEMPAASPVSAAAMAAETSSTVSITRCSVSPSRAFSTITNPCSRKCLHEVE